MLASLGVIVALKAGLFNIGIAGQMLASAFITTIVIGYSGLDAYAAKPLVMYFDGQFQDAEDKEDRKSVV